MTGESRCLGRLVGPSPEGPRQDGCMRSTALEESCPRRPGGTASVRDERVAERWARRAEVSSDDTGARAVVMAAVDALDLGEARVAQPDPATGEIVVDERAKRAILLAFRLLPMEQTHAGDFRYHDRVPLKSRLDGVRAVPGAIARWGCYLAPGVVLMPSFVNIGAYVDTGTMVDTSATVRACSPIGTDVHLSRR